jgi:hypothetical protein
MARRKLLEDSPIACSASPLQSRVHSQSAICVQHAKRRNAASLSSNLRSCPLPAANEDPVLFDTAEIPWWAWVRRFHLPEVRQKTPPKRTPSCCSLLLAHNTWRDVPARLNSCVFHNLQLQAQAEKLNGRAAMVGYVLALGVDQLTGAWRCVRAVWPCICATCRPCCGLLCAPRAAVDLLSMPAGVGLLDQQNSFFGKVLLHVAVFGILLIRSSSDVDRFKGLIDEAFYYDKQWQST